MLSLACALSAVSPRVVAAHDPPPVALEMQVTEIEVDAFIQMRAALYELWLGSDPARILDLPDAAWTAEAARLAAFLHEHAPLRIDDVTVPPRVLEIDYQEGFEVNDYIDYVAISASYGLKGRPRRVEPSWQRYDGEGGWPFDKVEAIVSHDMRLRACLFTAGEPSCTVHLPREARERVVSLRAEPPPRPTLPLVSIALGVLALATLLVGGRVRASGRSLSRAGRAALAVGVAGIAFACAGIRTPLPDSWRASVPVPPPEEAVAIFEALLRNVYRAFDYDTEEEVYEVLAASVGEELLDETYDEVYRNLILEEEGGAVSRVRGVDVMECTVRSTPPGGAAARRGPDGSPSSASGAGSSATGSLPSFHIESRWQVTGSVEHWGHRHLRTHEYHALYTVAVTGEQWRLHAVEVLGQERVGPAAGSAGGADPAPDPADPEDRAPRGEPL